MIAADQRDLDAWCSGRAGVRELHVARRWRARLSGRSVRRLYLDRVQTRNECARSIELHARACVLYLRGQTSIEMRASARGISFECGDVATSPARSKCMPAHACCISRAGPRSRRALEGVRLMERVQGYAL